MGVGLAGKSVRIVRCICPSLQRGVRRLLPIAARCTHVIGTSVGQTLEPGECGLD